ncbi:MAG: tRNA dimethylallyltransferase, partial [Moraxella sp.]|nr:tRNA dimethylallyltransferase [Moraxella sp.]
PMICQKLKVSDTQRIGRAVEVHLQTNQTMSQWQSIPKIALSHDKKWRWYALSVMPDRAWLHERIKKRLDGMWQAGFVEEVVEIVKTYPITPDMPSMRCIGYRQVLEFLLQIRHPACLDNDVLMAHEYAQKTSNLLKNHADCTKRIQIDTQNACQEMKNRALYATRQLAKRQYTWLRQLNLMGVPTTDASLNGINHITRASFNCIKEVEKQLIKN